MLRTSGKPEELLLAYLHVQRIRAEAQGLPREVLAGGQEPSKGVLRRHVPTGGQT